jgi:integrase
MPLYKRKDSPYWWCSIGSETRVSTGTADRAAAEEFERVLTQRKWRVEKLGDRAAVAWSEVAERWLNADAKPKKRDREFLGWLTPRIGSFSISDVADPDALEELRKDGIADGWSQSTVDRMMGTVSAVLNSYANNLDRVPVIPMYRPGLDEPRFLTPPELEKLCSHLPMHLALAARFAVATLLRMRAMLKLEWKRVDLADGKAWVPRVHQKAKRTFGLPLTSEAVRVLRALRAINGPRADRVFLWMGRPIDDCNTKAFQDAVVAAKVAPLRWHDLRHTGASWAVQSGVTLPELMLLGDWKDYRSVLRYAHLAPSQAAVAAERTAEWAKKLKVGNG